jgi:hypothetical protein
MFTKKIPKIQFAIVTIFVALNMQAIAQSNPHREAAAATADQQPKQDKRAVKTEDEELEDRLLQSNGLLVETAYHQERGEVQHTINFSRSSRDGWASVVSQEWPLFSEKHQLSFSLPADLLVKRGDGNRGVGDLTVEYSYFLIGNNKSRITVSPGGGFSLPTGSVAKGFGAGGPGGISQTANQRHAQPEIRFELNRRTRLRPSCEKQRGRSISHLEL